MISQRILLNDIEKYGLILASVWKVEKSNRDKNFPRTFEIIWFEDHHLRIQNNQGF